METLWQEVRSHVGLREPSPKMRGWFWYTRVGTTPVQTGSTPGTEHGGLQAMLLPRVQMLGDGPGHGHLPAAL